ncbi:MAG: hypothetical protein OEZ02_09685 [Anaerolineae bacterium]|nr:hypothetical protein [Anaerolineae bacterium]
MAEKSAFSLSSIMDGIVITLYLLLGFALRIAVPIGITVLLACYLRRLDARWQAEAKQMQDHALGAVQSPPAQSCWEYKNCSPDVRTQCLAHQQTEIPCWEVFKNNGSLRKLCQDCDYRLSTLIPAAGLSSSIGD